MFNFPPPPPPHAVKAPPPVNTDISPLPSELDLFATPIPSHTRSSMPSFLSTTNRSKTEPSIAISDAQASSVEQHSLTIEELTRPLQDERLLQQGTSELSKEDVVDLLSASFISESDVPLLLDTTTNTTGTSHSTTKSATTTTPTTTTDLLFREPAVSRLISLSIGGDESTGDEDDTSNLVMAMGDTPTGPVPKPRKKKQNRPLGADGKEFQRSKTVHGRSGNAPPPRPPPYKKKSVSPPPTADSSQLTNTPSPPPDNDLVPMITTKPSIPPKPDPPLSQRASGGSFSDKDSMLLDGDNRCIL